MPGLFDLIQSAMGRPDPSQQIAAALGQGPGQPGSPAGPQPLAGQPQPPGGGQPGAPGPAGASPGPAAPNPIQTQQQPNPAYATPQDLGSMFVTLMQRQQSAEMFNRGLGMIAAGFSPPHDRAMMMQSMEGMSGPDPGSTMNAIMQLQQRVALAQGLPKMLGDAGISQDYAPLVMANPGLLSDILKVRMGVTGDPAERALQAARADWMQRNPSQTEADMLKAHPEFSDAISLAAARTAQATAASTEARTKTNDILAAHSALPGINDSSDDALARVDRILAAPNLGNVLGVKGGLWTAIKGGAGFGDDDVALAKDIQQLGAQTYSEGLSSDALKGSRKTQAEARGVADSLSQVNQTNQGEQSYRFQLQLLRDKLMRMKANATASAGVQPAGDLAGYEDRDFYDENGPLAGQTMPKTFMSRPTQAPPAPAAAAAAQPAQPAQGGAQAATPLKPLTDAQKQQARDLIARDGRDPVLEHLKAGGYDTSGL
jgi:hypothetical protein